MSTEKVTRDSWKIIPMPEAKVRLEVDQTLMFLKEIICSNGAKINLKNRLRAQH
jgi:hypothetical protein